MLRKDENKRVYLAYKEEEEKKTNKFEFCLRIHNILQCLHFIKELYPRLPPVHETILICSDTS